MSPTVGKVAVDPDKCIGSANCVAIAPEVLDLGDDGKAYVKPDADLKDVVSILDAAKSCPVEAITVHDANGKQIWPKET